MVTKERLKSILEYKEGDFYWKITGKGIKHKGCLAGSIRNTGYRAIRIYGKLYQAHNLVWLYFNGEYIPGSVDHKNGNRIDNRIENLRKATKSENAMNKCIQSNNTSGVTGVFFRKDTGKWSACIGKGKVIENGIVVKSGRRYLGCFDSFEDAVKARKDAEKEVFGGWSFDESRND